MGLQWQKPGVSHVGEYQASGHTFVVTGSANNVFLKYVASGITVHNSDNSNTKDLKIFDSNHVGLAFTVAPGATVNFKGKFLTFNVPAPMSALVSVTNIPSASYTPPIRSELFRHS